MPDLFVLKYQFSTGYLFFTGNSVIYFTHQQGFYRIKYLDGGLTESGYNMPENKQAGIQGSIHRYVKILSNMLLSNY